MIERFNKYLGLESLVPTIGIFALTFYFLSHRGFTRKYPAGPKGFPFVGCVTQLGRHPAKTLTALSTKYGSVFSIQIGLRNWVVLNDYDCIRQALLKQGNDFSGRPNLLLLRQMSDGKGIIFRDYGVEWKTQKNFVISTLKEFGVGKKRLEDLVLNEVNHLAEEILARSEESHHTQKLIAKATGNIICELVLGSRMLYSDKTYSELVSCLDTTFFNEETMPAMLALLVAPIVRFAPGFRKVYSKFCQDLDKTFEILRTILESQKEKFNADDIRCLADAFLVVTKKKEKKVPGFEERQLFQLIRELFVAGSVNNSSVIRWCFLSFLKFPEHQERIYEEIVAVIGESGTPMMKHKSEMPYTRAFIQEILRHRTFVPFGMPHKTTRDTTLHGHEIPKNTPILINLWAVHHDPKLFKDPEEFRPERFLNKQGQYEVDHHVIPFSIGSRYCLADQMSKAVIFLFLVGILQKFKVTPNPKTSPPEFSDGVHGIVYTPQRFDVIFEER